MRCFRIGSRNNVRGTRFVNKYGVNLVNNGKMIIAPLHNLGNIRHHVIPEIIESELAVDAVRYIGFVCLFPAD